MLIAHSTGRSLGLPTLAQRRGQVFAYAPAGRLRNRAELINGHAELEGVIVRGVRWRLMPPTKYIADRMKMDSIRGGH